MTDEELEGLVRKYLCDADVALHDVLLRIREHPCVKCNNTGTYSELVGHPEDSHCTVDVACECEIGRAISAKWTEEA